jgi:hypothetical protein
MFSPEDEAIMRELNEVLDEIQQRGGMWGTAAYVAQRLIIELWRDVDKAKTCPSCKYAQYEFCDPDGEGEAFERWRTCGGSYKLNCEWRGAQ